MVSTSNILGPYTIKATVPSLQSQGYEDPVIWCSGGQYHLVANGYNARKANHYTSVDGINNWKNMGLAYDPTTDFVRYTDGTVNHWYKMERAGVVMENGHVTAFTFAVIDVDKTLDLANDTHGSKVIVVPFDGVAFDRDNPGPGSAACPADSGSSPDAGQAGGSGGIGGGSVAGGATGSGGKTGGGGTTGAGGVEGTGGKSGSGGTTAVVGTGGGSSSTATGGIIGAGGATGTGGKTGTTGTGGGASTGGATVGTGGNVGLGGAVATGGSIGNGGATSSGSNVLGGSAETGGTLGGGATGGATVGTVSPGANSGCSCRIGSSRVAAANLPVFALFLLAMVLRIRRRHV